MGGAPGVKVRLRVSFVTRRICCWLVPHYPVDIRQADGVHCVCRAPRSVNPKRKGPDMTDFLALANEAICYEGSDTYLGATSEQLAYVLAANTDLWTPATDDTSWSIDDEDGFMAALAAKVNPETPLSARKAAAEGTDNDPVATGFAGVAPTNLPRRPAWSPEPEWLGCADPGQGKRIRAAVSSMWGTTRDNRGVAAVLIGATADPDTGNQHGDVDIRVRVMAWGGFEGEEPDKRFRVLAGSQWRKPTLNPDATTYKRQVNVDMMQKELISQGVLDTASMKLTRDHVFRNWADATQVISGKPQYSGGYHWQRLTGDGGESSS